MQALVVFGPVTYGAPAAPTDHAIVRRSHAKPTLTAEAAAEMFARRLELTREERVFYIKAAPRQVYTAEILQGFVLRRWTKTCQDCGMTEAASLYCSRCLLPSIPTEWYSKRTKPMPPMTATYRAQLLRSYQMPAEDGAPVISGDLADDLGDDADVDFEDDED